ncbi:valine--tRNA ligase [Buchnera aphidicola (Mindarus keteleerifoliae)]|uniref:valine--tRNA ligase n=1 Tax=Buchnera aphidicola TaxID=9 RepID=UPI0031B6ABE7
MNKQYNPKDIEKEIYSFWEKSNFFKPTNNKNKKNFCIIMPPPNITGSLHMGHAFQQTIMDILVRYNRMKGKNTLWKVGTDHAGIATQAIVERNICIKKFKKTRRELGRKKFVNEIWKWKKKSHERISYQIRRLGCSVDWSSERFSLDQDMKIAVKKVFIYLYEKKLIYKKKCLSNWDFNLKTVVSDLEVNNRVQIGKMWYIKYFFVPERKCSLKKKYLVVATTRPETLLGDTAIAVHPEDERYKEYIGEKVSVPLINRTIPIISDKRIDIKKGTGCVKITPAHDFQDYDIAISHNLPLINIFTLEGKVLNLLEIQDIKGKLSNTYSNYIPKKFRNLEKSLVRKKIIQEIKKNNFLKCVKEYEHSVPISERSNSIIEPILTNQWYLKTKKISKVAIEAVKNGKIQFLPSKYKKLYFYWMENIKDWCISRQLWWGHRIPIWYDKKNNIYAGYDEKNVRKKYGLSEKIFLFQEKDVLDTWFSSALWSFSSLGWPKLSKELIYFHPTNILVSGFDIIFFWIARMIMMTMFILKDKNNVPQVPFKKVYITGLIRDESGKKMSKSKGNIIDPIDMIDGISFDELLIKRTKNLIKSNLFKKITKLTKKEFPLGIKSFGADALRFTCAALASLNREINWDMSRLKGYKHFCNKLWNASRFIFLNIKNTQNDSIKNNVLSEIDKWIFSELHNTIKSFTQALKKYRFDIAANILYNFIWNQFCDWYIEFSKITLIHGSKKEKEGNRYTLITVLEILLRLSHPVIPFITECIWKKIKNILEIDSTSIMVSNFPKFNFKLVDHDSILYVINMKKIISIIRKIRLSMKLSNKILISVMFYKPSDVIKYIIEKYEKYILFSVGLRSIKILPSNKNIPVCIKKNIDKTEIMVPILGLINKKKEFLETSVKLKKIVLKIKKVQLQLKNNNFLLNAPKVVIKKNEEMLSFLKMEKRDLLNYQKLIKKI